MPEASETAARIDTPIPVTTMELDAVARRAERLYEQGHLEAARQLALKVATRRPDHLQALLTLGHVLREVGAFDDVLAVLRRIGELSPGHVNAAAYLCPFPAATRRHRQQGDLRHSAALNASAQVA